MAEQKPTTDPYADETWKPVAGHEGFYEASDYGRVRSLDRTISKKDGSTQRVRGVMMKPRVDWQGRRYIDLQKVGVINRLSVHRIIIETFSGPVPEGMEVCHNNGDPSDNRLSNLRYDTRSENMRDKRKHGTDFQLNKTECPRGHSLAAPNLVVSTWENHQRRDCLACARARAYVSYHKDSKPEYQKISDSYYEDIMQQAA